MVQHFEIPEDMLLISEISEYLISEYICQGFEIPKHFFLIFEDIFLISEISEHMFLLSEICEYMLLFCEFF